MMLAKLANSLVERNMPKRAASSVPRLRLLFNQHIRQLVRLQRQIVRPLQILVLQRRASLRNKAADLSNRVLFIAAQSARQALQILFC